MAHLLKIAVLLAFLVVVDAFRTSSSMGSAMRRLPKLRAADSLIKLEVNLGNDVVANLNFRPLLDGKLNSCNICEILSLKSCISRCICARIDSCDCIVSDPVRFGCRAKGTHVFAVVDHCWYYFLLLMNVVVKPSAKGLTVIVTKDGEGGERVGDILRFTT